ncbi:MAG: hypothetical protein ACP5D7_24235 [Limnospira sp.]
MSPIPLISIFSENCLSNFTEIAMLGRLKIEGKYGCIAVSARVFTVLEKGKNLETLIPPFLFPTEHRAPSTPQRAALYLVTHQKSRSLFGCGYGSKFGLEINPD